MHVSFLACVSSKLRWRFFFSFSSVLLHFSLTNSFFLIIIIIRVSSVWTEKSNERRRDRRRRKKKNGNCRSTSEHLFCGLVARASDGNRIGSRTLQRLRRASECGGFVCNRKKKKKANESECLKSVYSEVAIRQKSFRFHLPAHSEWHRCRRHRRHRRWRQRRRQRNEKEKELLDKCVCGHNSP